jgi:hypothetical protein
MISPTSPVISYHFVSFFFFDLLFLVVITPILDTVAESFLSKDTPFSIVPRTISLVVQRSPMTLPPQNARLIGFEHVGVCQYELVGVWYPRYFNGSFPSALDYF